MIACDCDIDLEIQTAPREASFEKQGIPFPAGTLAKKASGACRSPQPLTSTLTDRGDSRKRGCE
jgi:hypothetical protein